MKRPASEAGIGDEGQASKLLKRLAARGLIEDTGTRAPGEANAWRLTERGAEVLRVMRSSQDGDG
jgi:DNA-binding PadR family transcriptional regulator